MKELLITSLSLFDTTKQDRQSFASQLIEKIMDGEEDSLQVLIKLKSMEDIIKRITSDDRFKDVLLEQAAKHGKRSEHHNATLEIKENGVRFDFETTGDPIWKKLKDGLKERESFLKALPKVGMQYVDEGTGEIVMIYPPQRSSTTGVTVTLK